MKILFAIVLFFGAFTVQAQDTPNLSLKVHAQTFMLNFNDCYSVINVIPTSGIVSAFCQTMQVLPVQTNFNRTGGTRWQFNANWSDVIGFESDNCRLDHDTQSQGQRTIELTCRAVQSYDPNMCGPAPCP